MQNTGIQMTRSLGYRMAHLDGLEISISSFRRDPLPPVPQAASHWRHATRLLGLTCALTIGVAFHLPSMAQQLTRQATKPVEQYPVFRTGKNVQYNEAEHRSTQAVLRTAYWAAAPYSEAGMAYDHLSEYRMLRDTFARADLAKARSDQLKTLHREVQGKNLLALEVQNGTLAGVRAYNSALKGFVVSLEARDGEWWSLDKPDGTERTFWSVALLGVDTRKAPGANERGGVLATVPEAEARSIEAAFAAARSGDTAYVPYRLLGRTIGVAPDAPQVSGSLVYLLVDAIQLLHPKTRNVLLTLNSQALGPTVVVVDSHQRAHLKLPEPPPAKKSGVVTIFSY